MFDANMRHLTDRKIFFAKVDYCESGTKLDKQGIRPNTVVLCQMIGGDSKNPKVLINNSFEMFNNDDFEDCLLIYSGNIDGTGFIDEDEKEEAFKLVNLQIREIGEGTWIGASPEEYAFADSSVEYDSRIVVTI